MRGCFTYPLLEFLESGFRPRERYCKAGEMQEGCNQLEAFQLA